MEKGIRNNVGKGRAAAGADSNLRRPEAGGETKGDGRGMVWRMSPYERGRELTPPEAVLATAPDAVTPSPGEGALGTWRFLRCDTSGHRAGSRGSGLRERALGQTASRWGVCESALKPRRPRAGRKGTSQGQNRTRETRPSGIAGGPREPWPWWNCEPTRQPKGPGW